MVRVYSFKAILAFHCLYQVSTAFLFAQCNPFKRERIDPLVSYGVESSHMHTFFGSSAISPTTNTSAQLREGCSSCSNKLDTSAYWIPTLYYVTNTSRTPVQVGFRAYYQGQSDTTGEFPEDYRIIVGSPDTTPEDLSPAISSGVNFYCRTGGVQESKNQYDLITQPCNQMNGNIGFPGSVVYDATLNRYRACVGGDSGCASIPGMFLSVSYSVGPYKFLPGEYLELSTGAGYTYHADFIMGWAKSALDQLSHNTTSDLQIGAPDSLQVPAQCVDSPAIISNLTSEDIATAKEIYQIDGTISGSYGFDLTITDGLTINDGMLPNTSLNTSVLSNYGQNASVSNSSYTYGLPPSVSTTSSPPLSQVSAVKATSTTSFPALSPASYIESTPNAFSSSSPLSQVSAVKATSITSFPAWSLASSIESTPNAFFSSSPWSPASAVEATQNSPTTLLTITTILTLTLGPGPTASAATDYNGFHSPCLPTV